MFANAIRHHQSGRLDDAIACYQKAIDLKPGFPDAHNNMGVALREQGRLTDAIACYTRAINLNRNYPDAYSNLGAVLQAQGRLDEAVAGYRHAIDLKPDYPQAYIGLGSTLQRQRQLEEAVACFRKAIELRPDDPDAHNNLAMTLLTRGEMAADWAEYEWRWKTPQMIRHRRDRARPQWYGEAAEGQTLLVHAEQGFGDTMQFCRYAPLAAACGLRVIMDVPAPLVRLMRSLAGVDLVVAQGDESPPFDLHCPMLSMPLALGTTLETIPGAVPYLQADGAQVGLWHSRLAAMAKKGSSDRPGMGRQSTKPLAHLGRR